MKNAELVLQLALAGLQGDQRTLRSLALSAIRLLKKEDPEKAQVLASALAHVDVGASALRAQGLGGPPTDKDTGMNLVRAVSSPAANLPVLNSNVTSKVDQFLREHLSAVKLIEAGLMPPSSLLLVGEPGVGKTMLAEYFAARTGRKLLILDLATSMSSFLGKTGQNLRSVLDYAREHSSVLFLDEFDSIAKRRDDPSDLGELKRIVNILLKELETWPPHSLLIAATNHPELLDKAIWRRFDSVIEIPRPGPKERFNLLVGKLSLADKERPFLEIIANMTEGLSASLLVQFTERVRRRQTLEEGDFHKMALQELASFLDVGSTKARKEFSKLCHESIPHITYEEIADWLGVAVSTVHYHVKGKARDSRA